MTMGNKTLGVTIPEELYELMDEKRMAGHYSRSEFVREALRRCLSIPTVEATAEEADAIERGRAEVAGGNYVTPDQLKEESRGTSS